MSTEVAANRYPDACDRCGAKVPAGTGIYASHVVTHLTEDDCKKTTKTWKRYETGRQHNAMRDGIEAAWVEIGQFDVGPGMPLSRSIKRNGRRWVVVFGTQMSVADGHTNTRLFALDYALGATRVDEARANAARVAAAIDAWG